MRRTYANVARQITVLQVCNVHIIFGLHCTPPATLPLSSLSFPWLCLQSSLRVYHLCGLQAVLRGKRARRRYKGMLVRRNRSAITVQAIMRTFISRAKFNIFRSAVCVLQV